MNYALSVARLIEILSTLPDKEAPVVILIDGEELRVRSVLAPEGEQRIAAQLESNPA